ncbi:MAG: sigma 54-interacting transcriptional regulator [Myxococcales bacterium]|nr:sigma 54-interacting transcriptional regulator [Myxococcales bacterium]MCB9642739.1 sigma 54-interacting transcriptional regulator [Myxococcales bacterium]
MVRFDAEQQKKCLVPEELGAWALQQILRVFGAEDAFRVLAELLPDAAVFVVDANREIRYWSKGAEKLLGFQSEQVMGQMCLRANRCASCMTGCGIAEKGLVEGARLTLYHSDGRPIALRKSGRAFFDEKGGFLGGIEILFPDRQPAQPYPTISPDTVNFHGLWSRSPSMHRAFEIVRNVATSDTSVLVRGDSGTGKEIIARAIHEESHRSHRRFLAVNCAALTPTLLESELFGHLKGAFTGAVRDRAGLFAQADGGTLFLDEVAELPMSLQAKLLRVLQERTFVPVGGTQPIQVDVRIVAATHRSLRHLVQLGAFREDLMYRLRVVPIYLPPLRERREDIELLLWHFIRQRNQQGRRLVSSVSPEAMRAMLNHDWPGNVREMQNVVDYAFAVGRGEEFGYDELPPEFDATRGAAVMGRSASVPLPPHLVAGAAWEDVPAAPASSSLLPPPSSALMSNPSSASLDPFVAPGSSGGLALPPTSSAYLSGRSGLPVALGSKSYTMEEGEESFDEKEQIERALRIAEGHMTRAAELLGMSRTTFWRKRKRYGV